MSRKQFPSTPPPSRPERRPEPTQLGAADPLLQPSADPGIPDKARFFARPGTMAEDHFGESPVTAAQIRRRGFSPEKWASLSFLRPIPDGV